MIPEIRKSLFTTDLTEGSHRAVRSGGTFRAFANQNYTRVWLSNCLSHTSRWMQITLLAWLILELTNSPWYVALVGFFYMFPTLVLGLAGGVLADEMDRRRLLLVTQGVSILASSWLILLLITGAVQVWHGYLTALINGASWAISFPSRRALIFDLFPTRQWCRLLHAMCCMSALYLWESLYFGNRGPP